MSINSKRKRERKRQRKPQAETYSAPKRLLVVKISHQEINSTNVGCVVKSISAIISQKGHKAVLNNVLYACDGYDDDPREICEIPEIRHFFSTLLTCLPILPFAIRGSQHDSDLLRAFMATQLDVSVISGVGSKSLAGVRDTPECIALMIAKWSQDYLATVGQSDHAVAKLIAQRTSLLSSICQQGVSQPQP
ncbi:hypothetical protein HAP94_13895 [Acidithiobacillus ferrivorans]|nr:hypothetical protein [Acidithiobacillus ferrivorans]